MICSYTNFINYVTSAISRVASNIASFFKSIKNSTSNDNSNIKSQSKSKTISIQKNIQIFQKNNNNNNNNSSISKIKKNNNNMLSSSSSISIISNNNNNKSLDISSFKIASKIAAASLESARLTRTIECFSHESIIDCRSSRSNNNSNNKKYTAKDALLLTRKIQNKDLPSSSPFSSFSSLAPLASIQQQAEAIAAAIISDQGSSSAILVAKEILVRREREREKEREIQIQIQREGEEKIAKKT